MRSEQEIEKRIQKLTNRYVQNHVKENLNKSPGNCVYSQLYENDEYTQSESYDVAYSKTKSTTLLVVNSVDSSYICTYGENGNRWNGIICDENVCKKCKKFLSKSISKQDMEQLMNDDDYLNENHRDIVELRWALGEKPQPELSFISLLMISIYSMFVKMLSVVSSIGKLIK